MRLSDIANKAATSDAVGQLACLWGFAKEAPRRVTSLIGDAGAARPKQTLA
jgi:hypothetical protein